MLLVKDDNGNVLQAVRLPATGQTTNITTVIGSAASVAALDGFYRITTTADVYICAGDTAAATDQPLWAGTDMYCYISDNKLAAYCATAGGKVSATKIS